MPDDQIIGYDVSGKPITKQPTGYDASGSPVYDAVAPQGGSTPVPRIAQKVADTIRSTKGGPTGFMPIAMSDYVKEDMARLIEDPGEFLPTGAAQVGATAGTMLGGPLGGVAGATIGGGLGKVLQNKFRARPVTQGVGAEAALQGAGQSLPMAGKGIKWAGKTLYTKALRPAAQDMAKMAESSRLLPEGVRSYLANLGLKHDIPISFSGLRKIEDIKGQIDDRIQQMLADADSRGVQVDMNAVRQQAEGQLRGNFATQSIPQDDMATIDAAMSKFGENPALVKPQMQATMPGERFMQGVRGEPAPMFSQTGQRFGARQPVGKVNEIRVGTNKATKDKFGELKRAGVEANKALSRAEGDAVKAAVPETAPLFQDWHDLINLQKVLTRTTTNSANAQPIRLYEMLGALSGNPAAVGLGTFSRPSVQGFAGRKMYHAGSAFTDIPPEAVRAAILAVMTNQQEPR